MSSPYVISMLHDTFYILQVWACNLRINSHLQFGELQSHPYILPTSYDFYDYATTANSYSCSCIST